MGKIRALSRDIIGKIAAGEVVERPAAAIKELVENSLDAGATAISVEIREGGVDTIRVSDNGSGIAESDIRLAFERHATSKISRETDLDAIGTLGFRGEALASIAAVSRVTMTTRTAERETGLRVQNEGGIITDIREAACPVGTTFQIRDLFFNTPVRRGFLKKVSAETGAVTELMSRFILSRPDVSFRYSADGKNIWHAPGDGQLRSAVYTVFGGTALDHMREIHGHANGILVDGFVGIGELARGNRNQEIFFINRRIMRSEILSGAVEAACRERVMIGKYPTCVLNITVPFENVDVNVHPNKLEVRFRDEAGISEGLMMLVLEGLRDRDAFEKPVEMRLTPPEEKSSDENALYRRNAAGTAARNQPDILVKTVETVPEVQTDPGVNRPEPVFRERTLADSLLALQELPPDLPGSNGQEEKKTDLEPNRSVSENLTSDAMAEKPESCLDTPGRKPLAKSLDAHVSIENPFLNAMEDAGPVFREAAHSTGKSIIDNQHASGGFFPAAEEMTEQIDTLAGAPAPMRIFGALFNTFILIEYEDSLLLVDQHAVHERLNFNRMMAAFGKEGAGQELLVPIVMSVSRKEMALLEENSGLLRQIGLVTEPFGEADVAIRTIPMLLGETQTTAFVREILDELEAGRDPTFEKKRTILLQSACKHAVKGGEQLPESVLRSLVEEMIEKRVTPTCPHGRPLVVSITHRELDRKFKRIQN